MVSDQGLKVTGRNQTDHGQAGGFKGFATALLPVDQRQDPHNHPSGAPNGLNRLERGASGGDDVFHHHHLVSGVERAFNQFAGAMLFGFLSMTGWMFLLISD